MTSAANTERKLLHICVVLEDGTEQWMDAQEIKIENEDFVLVNGFWATIRPKDWREDS